MLNQFLSPASVWQKLFLLIPVLVLLAASVSPGQAVGLRSAPVPRNLRFETVVGGLDNPLFATHAGDGSNRLFTVQPVGQILILENGGPNAAPFLDIWGLISCWRGAGPPERRLPPGLREERLLLRRLHRHLLGGDVARYSVSANLTAPTPSGTALTSPRPAVRQPQRRPCSLSVPTAGSTSPWATAAAPTTPRETARTAGPAGQDPAPRCDAGDPYAIPPDNPSSTIRGPAAPEIWAVGLRNPWRFSFDRSPATCTWGRGSVDPGGGGLRARRRRGGRNYGWDDMEGNLCHNATTCTPPPAYVPPVMVHDHGANDETAARSPADMSTAVPVSRTCRASISTRIFASGRSGG